MDFLHTIRKIEANRYSYIESNQWLATHEPSDVIRAATPNVPPSYITLEGSEPHGDRHTRITFRIDLPA